MSPFSIFSLNDFTFWDVKVQQSVILYVNAFLKMFLHCETQHHELDFGKEGEKVCFYESIH